MSKSFEFLVDPLDFVSVLLYAALKIGVFEAQLPGSECTRQNQKNVTELEGFEDEIECAGFHGVDGSFDGSLAGHYDADEIGVDFEG
jgi:hypothetical protein